MLRLMHLIYIFNCNSPIQVATIINFLNCGNLTIRRPYKIASSFSASAANVRITGILKLYQESITLTPGKHSVPPHKQYI